MGKICIKNFRSAKMNSLKANTKPHITSGGIIHSYIGRSRQTLILKKLNGKLVTIKCQGEVILHYII